MIRSNLGRILFGTKSGSGRFAGVVVLGGLALEFVYTPWVENLWFNGINNDRSYQTILPVILAQQEACGGDDDEEDEDEDDE